MKTNTTILGATATITIAVAFAGAVPFAYADDPAIEGKVLYAMTEGVEVQINPDSDVHIGDHLEIIRHELVAPNPKAGLVIHSAHVGDIEITAVGYDHRASAKIVNGSAKSRDWVARKRA